MSYYLIRISETGELKKIRFDDKKFHYTSILPCLECEYVDVIIPENLNYITGNADVDLDRSDYCMIVDDNFLIDERRPNLLATFCYRGGAEMIAGPVLIGRRERDTSEAADVYAMEEKEADILLEILTYL